MKFRQWLKVGAVALFQCMLFPVYVLYKLLALMSTPDRAFQGFSQLLSIIPGRVGIYTRAAFYSYSCDQTSTDISIGFLTILSHCNTHFADGVYIGAQCNIGMSSIGEKTLLGSGVHILSGKHQHAFDNPNIPIKDQGGIFTKINIGADCWVGNNAVIMADIGSRCVVAAGTVVTSEFGSNSVIAGNPAKLIKKIP